MSVDEFIFDLGEFEEEVVEEHATQERVRKSGWRKEKGRYLCLVPNCRERKLDFVRKFALVRHWEEVHVSTIELSKSTVQSSCQSLKRAYDLERHYRRKHELNHLQAKPLSQGEKLKRKVVENRNYVAPGTLVGPKDKLGTGLGKPFTETRPGPNEMEVTLAVVRVEIDNVLDEEVDMILQSVPEPEIKKVIGINLSHKEQERKNKLIKDIWTARVLIREWTRREKEAKDELKRLEVKEQRLREKVLQEQLRGERSERRKMEVVMRQLKGQMDRRKNPKKDRVPLLLLCGHSFCQSCLIKHEKNQASSVTCPECSETTELKPGESWSEKLKPDVYLIGLLTLHELEMANITDEIIQHTERKDTPHAQGITDVCRNEEVCDECSSQTAVCHCSKCDVNLCKSCFEKVHYSSKILRKHEASPLPSASKVTALGNQCSIHERLIEYFCEEDQVPICSHCVIVGTHKDHVISAMEEKTAEFLNEIKTSLWQTENVLVLLKRSDMVIDDILAELRRSGIRLINHIKSHFTAIHSSVQLREQLLVKQVQELFRKQRLPVEDLRRKLLEDVKTLEHIIAESQRVVQHNEEGFVHAQILVQKLKHSAEKACYLEYKQTSEAEEQLKSLIFQESLDEQIQCHGEVKFDAFLRLDMLKLNDVSDDMFNEIQRLQDECDRKTAEDDADMESVQNEDTVFSTEKPQQISRLTSKQEKVYVTHIKNPVHFVVQRFTDVHHLNALGREINSFCRSKAAENGKLTHVKTGDIVLCHFEYDNNWYRAEVIDVKDVSGSVEIEVFYIDYGNIETVTIDRLCAIKKQFTTIPQLSSTCSLKEIAPYKGDTWSEEATQVFARLTQDKPMRMTVLSQGEGVVYVDLSKLEHEDIIDDRPVSVTDALLFLELAVFTGPGTVISKQPGFSKGFIKPSLHELPRATLCAAISHVNSPHSFYVQRIGGEMKYLTEMMAQVQRVYENDKSDLYTVFIPQKGEACVAKFKEDEAWYRAQVVELPGSQLVRVKFVDFGNTDEVHYLQVKKIRNEFLVLPTQALHCKLADIEPFGELWSEEAVEFLCCWTQKPLDLTVVNHDGERLSAVLHDISGEKPVSINAIMVQRGLAKSSGPSSKLNEGSHIDSDIEISGNEKAVSDSNTLSMPPLTRVLVSHIVHPGQFYIQLYSASEDGLNNLMKELQETYVSQQTDTSGRNWVKGDFCAVRYTTDNKWYRARVQEQSEDRQKVQVHLLDYGYKDLVDKHKLYQLSEKHCKVNCFSVQCHLQNIKPAGDKKMWSQTAVEIFRDKVQNQTVFIADFVTFQCESLPVELLIEEHIQGDALTANQIQYISMTEWLKDKGVALPECIGGRTKSQEERTEEKSLILLKNGVPEHKTQSYPPCTVPLNEPLQVIPTYVDYDCIVYVQPVYPETSSQGRYGYILKENTLEVMLQDDYLRCKNLYRAKIPRDGNCLFRCFAQKALGDQRKHEEVRKNTVSCFENEWKMFESLISNSDKETYIRQMSQAGSYGGEPEIQAMCHVYGIGACIYIGGLKSKIQERKYGKFESTVEMCYISNGSYDCGHYDMVVNTLEDKQSIDMVYAQWRESHLLNLSSNPKYYDTTYYDESVLGQLMEILQEEYQNTKEEHPAIEWVVNQPVIAKTEDYDSLFYRGIIREIGQTLVKVFFVDFGDTRKVEKKNLRSHIMFLSIPQQCFPVCVRNLMPLLGSAWNEKALTHVHDLLVNKTCTVFVRDCKNDSGEPAAVDFVMPDGTDLVQYLQDAGLAKLGALEDMPSEDKSDVGGTESSRKPSATEDESQNTTESLNAASIYSNSACDNGQNTAENSTSLKVPVRSVKSPYKVLEIGQENESIQVQVTQVDSPNQVYIQLVKSGTPALDKMLAELVEVNNIINNEMPNYPFLKTITPGTACCAKYSVDEMWYRAEIVENLDDRVGVVFVDYGNYEYLLEKELRQIPSDLLLLPAMAVCCFLDEIPSDGSWSAEHKLYMETLMLGKNLTAVIKTKNDDATTVRLYNAHEFEEFGECMPLIYQNLFRKRNSSDDRICGPGLSDLIGDDEEEINQENSA